jgi:methyltransferase (TIGR00027 family)
VTDNAAISTVADTALWVAAFRGKEGERPDAAFHDPLASMLAGEQGRAMARAIPGSASVGWAMVVRTSAIDALIYEAIRLGVDTILNLGAGLDTRPYRMSLPAHLRWIEIDFPRIVDLKDSKLTAHTPSCKIERVGLDLLNRSSRTELFARYGAHSKNTLLIAEGVLPYFANGDVAALVEDLTAIESFRYWVMDFDNAGKRGMPKAWAKHLRAAPFLFQVDDWFEFFRQSAWHPHKVITSDEQSARINRPYPYHFPSGLIMHALPRSVSRKILSLSGAALLRKHEV